MRKALHSLTLYSVASSALICSHCPVPTHLRVAIAPKIYLALFLVHTQLSTQFLHFWKLFFSMPSSQIITIISILSIAAAGIWLMQAPSLFQATVLTGLLQITVLLSSLCHTAGKALCIKYKSVFTPRRKSRFQCLTSKALPGCLCSVSAGSLWEWLPF